MGEKSDVKFLAMSRTSNGNKTGILPKNTTEAHLGREEMSSLVLFKSAKSK